jgi:hypothetical protein
MRETGMSRVAAQLAVPAVLGLILGVIVAYQSGSSNSGLAQIPLGTYVTPAAVETAAALAPVAPSMKNNSSCDLIVPADPLSAQGLATPYQLTGPGGKSPTESGCEMSNGAKLGAFVQATILDPATGALSVYEPLVITKGTKPDIPVGSKITPPAIPANAVVTLDFGFNGTSLTLTGATPTALADANCVSGEQGSAFGATSFCDGTAFFAAVRQAESKGLLKVPSPGTSTAIVPSGGAQGTGQDCPVTRNFEVADLAPGVGVTTSYLLNRLTGQTGQDSGSEQGFMAGATHVQALSANSVLDQYIDPLFGCTPFKAPDLSNAGVPAISAALDEITAGAYQPKAAALVPENDAIVRAGGKTDAAKTNLYRAELGQAPTGGQTDATSSPAAYCQNLVNIQAPFLAANSKLLATGGQSPVSATADNLLTFLASDLSSTFAGLGCQQFHLTNPVTLKRNSAGVATAATFDTAVQAAH